MRAADSQSHVLITMDGYYRNGKMLDHKAGADIALETAKNEGQTVDKVLVWRRHAGQSATASPFVKGRDFWVDEVLPKFKGQLVAPIPMDAEAPSVSHVHQRQHGKAERLSTPHRRLPLLCSRHL